MKFNILRTHENGITADEALKLTKKGLTNKQADDALQNYFEEIKKVDGWFWTATHISYKAGATTAEVWNEGEKKKTKIHLPLQDGWYLPDAKYGIPNGEPSSEANPAARYLIRYQSSDFSGLVSRWDDRWGDRDRRDVYCDDGPDDRLGVVETATGKGNCASQAITDDGDGIDWKAKYEALLAKVRGIVEDEGK